MRLGGQDFREVWAADFEFHAPDGERPVPICLVARELASGRTLRLWQDELARLQGPPYGIGGDCLFVAYYASAELGCHLSLGWPMPANVLDLYAEFRVLTNGQQTPCGAGLLGALVHFGLDAMAAAEKTDMRELALRGGPYSESERAGLLAYCEGDVDALAKLLPRMSPPLDMPRALPRALLRGRYMAAAARMEARGAPIDFHSLETLRTRWAAIQDRLVEQVDRDYGVYDGRTFKRDRFIRWLGENRIPWPRLPSGQLALDDETFRQAARTHPVVAPLRELRVSLSRMRLADLAVGSDDRNRCLLSAFRSKTGRNQPSNAKFIFGPAVWLRGLIRPEPGCAVAYVDWSAAEYGIGAALSGDMAMLEAYRSGDPYLAFAKQAGAVPPDATRETHSAVREQYKVAALAVQFGMGAETLAARIGQPVAQARELLRKHRQTYRRFWEWSDGAVDYARLRGTLHTVFGWTIHAGPGVTVRTLGNFLLQANGAEMLRLACILATERGIRVCAPIHDALLVEAPIDDIDDVVRETQRAMADASAVVLDGFRLRSDAYVVRHPDRYMDPRGRRMWETVWEILAEWDEDEGDPRWAPYLAHGGHPVQSYICIS